MTASEMAAVSIAIPFYNPGAALLDAVRSVFAQSYQKWELILLDDGSTDGSLELARSIHDPRVRVYSDGKNKKLAARLNEVVSLARYPLLARMDADDLMARNRIERQVALLNERRDLDLVSTGVCSLSDDCQPMGVRCVPHDHAITPRALLLGRSGILHASVMGRREWFERNPYREDLPKSQDTNLWVRAFSKSDLAISIIPEPLYYYREDGNVTVNKLKLAYKVGRITIGQDAREGFPLIERARAFGVSYAKSIAVTLLGQVGRIDLVRRRRNQQEMDAELKSGILRQIAEIRSVSLPIESSTKAALK